MEGDADADKHGSERLAFANAALALAGHEIVDPALRDIVERAARRQLTASEAIHIARRRSQGG
ncbi:hypothetical protein ACF3NT_02860 [Naumannella halotolerans]|uniref:hypothetical protein n=1 Tax=Naumannella halotolerans TaxID=993414 RepID=UPI00105FFAAC|nr:hypothetical protein [Naumannella halotolerans]